MTEQLPFGSALSSHTSGCGGCCDGSEPTKNTHTHSQGCRLTDHNMDSNFPLRIFHRMQLLLGTHSHTTPREPSPSAQLATFRIDFHPRGYSTWHLNLLHTFFFPRPKGKSKPLFSLSQTSTPTGEALVTTIFLHALLFL